MLLRLTFAWEGGRVIRKGDLLDLERVPEQKKWGPSTRTVSSTLGDDGVFSGGSHDLSVMLAIYDYLSKRLSASESLLEAVASI